MIDRSRPRVAHGILVVLASSLCATACGARPDAEAIPPAAAHQDSVPAAAAVPARQPDSSAARAPDVKGVATKAAPARTADTIRVKLIAGRMKKDSTSLIAAIRTGNRLQSSWPTGPAPIGAATFPGTRIVAFYGNPLSKKMGVLGEYPVEEMLAKLDKEVAAWTAADPSTPVKPALHLVAVVAQADAGRDGKYRARMDTALINKVLGWAERKNALLFLDIQVAKSTLQEEIPRLLPYLSRPNVHLGIDPEFSMHYNREGLKPGAKIGVMDAADVNYAVRTLAKIAADNNLPPKILVVHRFTQPMVTNTSQIKLDPHVQVVMDMDGWGPPWLKFDSYRAYAVSEPVQFTGFKIFYHNDTKQGHALLTPAEVLQLVPRPIYIQYQ
jgi:hypothetical protein